MILLPTEDLQGTFLNSRTLGQILLMLRVLIVNFLINHENLTLMQSWESYSILVDVQGKASSFRLPLKCMLMLFVMLIGAPILVLVNPSLHTASLLVTVGLLTFKETTDYFLNLYWSWISQDGFYILWNQLDKKSCYEFQCFFYLKQFLCTLIVNRFFMLLPTMSFMIEWST